MRPKPRPTGGTRMVPASSPVSLQDMEPNVPPMMETPTPAPQVPSEPDSGLRIHPWGWWLLAVLFAFLIISQNVIALQRPPKPEAKSAVSEVRSRLFFSYLADPTQILPEEAAGEAKQREQYTETREKTLQELRTKLVPHEAKDADAARLALILDRELKKPVDYSLISFLMSQKAPNPEFAKMYTHNEAPMTGLEAEKGFAKSLAEVQYIEQRDEKAKRAELMPKDRFGLTWLVLMGALGGIGLGTVLLLISIANFRSGKWQFIGGPLDTDDSEQSSRLALRMASYFILLFLMGGMLSSLLLELKVDTGLATFGGMVFATLVFVATLNFRSSTGETILARLLGPREMWGTFAKAGLWTFFANIPLVIVFASLGNLLTRFIPAPSHPATEMLGDNPTAATIALLFLSAGVLAPIGEELAFRGLLLGAQRRWMRAVGAGVVNGLLFAAIHPQGPALILGLASIGFAASMVTQMYRSVVPAIVMHAVHNSCVLVFGLIVLS
ncbi:MAG TPA: hypothetical protein DCY02_05275 [Armatimonadetes bacterium]|nr:hypothetical protein [Armatimonadota bacterium]HCM73523.1 hypothetical protein [Armatimonadota bacterium]